MQLLFLLPLLGIAIVQVLAAQADSAAIVIAGHHQPQDRCTRSSSSSSSWRDPNSKTTKPPRTTKNIAFPDGVTGWHPRKIDYRALTTVGVLQSGRLHIVTHSDFDDDGDDSLPVPVLAKMTDIYSPSDVLSLTREMAMYQRLDGTGITPAFLGHVTNENGRVIGFLLEYIMEKKDKRNNKHSMQACLAVLRRLHKHGIVHGDAHDGNCLLRGDGGTAALVDFELAEETPSAAEFARDIKIMDRCIRAIPDP